MQSANGVSYNGTNASIVQMIIDGTQGTSYGDGLVQGINTYGNIYSAARYYNSGQLNVSDLNSKEGATASYVNDITNRMTGWATLASRYESKCCRNTTAGANPTTDCDTSGS
jgi:hypothetical protein